MFLRFENRLYRNLEMPGGQRRPVPWRRAAWSASAARADLRVAVVLPFLAVTQALAFPPYAEEWPVPGQPQDVEVDPAGRVWVSSDDDSIRVYAPSGGDLLLTFGGTGMGAGEFLTPYGIAFDAIGNAYICDYAGSRVQKFADDGTFLLSWPVPSSRADHVAVDAAGDVYVTGYTDAAVHKYDALGTSLLDWSSPSGTLTSGIVESGGVISVVGWDLPVVEQFGSDGSYLSTFDAMTVNGTDVEVDVAGQLWVADFNGNAVRIFAGDGTPIESFGAPGAGPGEFDGLVGLALATDGSVYVADYANSRIQRFGDTAAVLGAGTLGGGAADPGLELRLLGPNPSRAGSEVAYSVRAAGRVAVTLSDVTGRKLATLADGVVPAGLHRVEIDLQRVYGRALPAGVYLVRIAAGEASQVARIVVVR